MINDDEISLTLPTQPRPDTNTDLGQLHASVRHAQIYSSIERELFSVKAREASLDEIQATVVRLDAELRAWHDGLRQEYSQYHLPNGNNPRIRHNHYLYLQHCFHGSLCVLHSVITQPWRGSRFQQSQDPAHVKQVQESSHIVAEASRSLILNSQSNEISAASPAW